MGCDWFAKRTIGSLVDDRATRDAERPALVFEGRRWTFAELAQDVDAVARGLIDLGLGPGDKVSLWMQNCTKLGANMPPPPPSPAGAAKPGPWPGS